MKLGALLHAAVLVLSAGGVDAQLGAPQLPNVDWAQNLGNRVPLDTRFTDSDGNEIALSDVVGERPTILALVYYECPMLCSMVLNGLVQSLRGFNFEVGNEFDVLVISIDPEETPELAAANRSGYVERYGGADASSDGWTFLVGESDAILAVTDAVGFEFEYVPETGEYAHAAGISVLTPSGELSRIFYGTEYSPRDLKFGLIDASEGGIGSPIEKFILRCFHYDPSKGRYGFAIMGTIRVLGSITVLLVVLSILRMIRNDRRRSRSGRKALAT